MRAPVRLLGAAVVAAGLVAGTACRPPVRPPALESGSPWILAPDVLGTPPPSGDVRPITADFELEHQGDHDGVPAVGTGIVRGSTGCNDYSGPYDKNGDRLTIGALTQTEIACDPDTMRREQAFAARLRRTESFRIDGTGVLHLRAPDGTELRFTAAPAAIPPPPTRGPVGAWNVTGYRSGTGFVPVEPGSAVTLNLQAGGRLSGRACNIFGGTWYVTPTSIAFTAEWMTDMACVSEPTMDQESYFLQALLSAQFWKEDADTLLLTDPGGATVVTAVRARGRGPVPAPTDPPETVTTVQEH